MADVKDVEVEGPRRVVFHFKSNENRELPLILGETAGAAEAFLAGRDFSKPLTDPPIGSGPYRIGQLRTGPQRDLRAAAGLVGARTCRPAREPTISTACASSISATSTVAMEAFKAGQIDLRSENISKHWATAYDFPGGAAGLGEQARVPPPSADRHAGLGR